MLESANGHHGMLPEVHLHSVYTIMYIYRIVLCMSSAVTRCPKESQELLNAWDLLFYESPWYISGIAMDCLISYAPYLTTSNTVWGAATAPYQLRKGVELNALRVSTHFDGEEAGLTTNTMQKITNIVYLWYVTLTLLIHVHRLDPSSSPIRQFTGLHVCSTPSYAIVRTTHIHVFQQNLLTVIWCIYTCTCTCTTMDSLELSASDSLLGTLWILPPFL